MEINDYFNKVITQLGKKFCGLCYFADDPSLVNVRNSLKDSQEGLMVLAYRYQEVRYKAGELQDALGETLQENQLVFIYL